MKTKLLQLIFLLVVLVPFVKIHAQEEEKVLYYQMEPLDDSLFIELQSQVFIDPPDPKAEIIVDLRDPNNQTISIKNTLYPMLAFKPEARARVQTYPFKINLEEGLNFGSVFTRVFSRLHVNKIVTPASLYQISPTLSYINPFFQVFGGERFGFPLKSDVGVSFGFGTPYSGPFETNFVEANFHILGLFVGAYGGMYQLSEYAPADQLNRIFGTLGYQIGYNLPFGNFFQVSYTSSTKKPNTYDLYEFYKADTAHKFTKVLDGSSVNWEFRYPVRLLGATRGKVYVAKYLNEWHLGFSGREMSIAGSTFDLRFDAMPKSDVRVPQYLVDILVQKIYDSWAYSAIAVGPSAIFSKDHKGRFGLTSVFLNFRLKLGTSL